MSAGPRGPTAGLPAPLDLPAVERDLHQTWNAEAAPRVLYDRAMALLALLRETRAALDQLLAEACASRTQQDEASVCRHPVHRRAAAVLAAAQDGPA